MTSQSCSQWSIDHGFLKHGFGEFVKRRRLCTQPSLESLGDTDVQQVPSSFVISGTKHPISSGSHRFEDACTGVVEKRDSDEGRVDRSLFIKESDMGGVEVDTGANGSYPSFDIEDSILKSEDSEKPFECVECQHRFTQKFHALDHVRRVHLDIRAYQCAHPGCGKRFKQKCTLARHVSVIHHGVKKYVCPHCQARFGQRNNLNTHVRLIHKQNPPSIA
mmetsp:Transcript_9920/g.17870  ORF Transcript_9920/g.17870 Transcript_9920/m.17870 type:complete len:219 (-) Transcript_9920:134-790(-)